jgi:hypothetical protein
MTWKLRKEGAACDLCSVVDKIAFDAKFINEYGVSRADSINDHCRTDIEGGREQFNIYERLLKCIQRT